MDKAQKETLKFAMWYMVVNSDDENIIEHLENSTNAWDTKNHEKYMQDIIDKLQ